MYKLRHDHREKVVRSRRKRLAILVAVAVAAITGWAVWTGVSQMWSLRSQARFNATEDECIKAGRATQGSQAEVCPDKTRNKTR